MKILFTGGSGFLGTHLIKALQQQGHTIVNLTRKVGVVQGTQNVYWTGKKIPAEAGQVDVIVNLAGAGIADKKWTDQRKQELLDSRIQATRACTEFIQQAAVKPKLFLSSSGINYYGADRSDEVNETSSAGTDFMGEICVKWEDAAKVEGVRTILLRTSVVLGKEDGAFPKLAKPFKFFIGGPLGNGQQGYPWIHVEDWVNAVLWMIDNETISGPVNMVAPQMLTNREFAKALGKALGRPSFFRLPKAVLKLVFGEMSVILWGGLKARPDVLVKSGFRFRYPEIQGALKELTKK